MRKFSDVLVLVLIVAVFILHFNDETMAEYITMAVAFLVLFIQDNIDDYVYFTKRANQVKQRRAIRSKIAN